MPNYTTDELFNEQGPPILMALLIDAIQRRKTITYGEASERLGGILGFTVGWDHVGGIAGTLMEKIWKTDKKAPPLNVLVVNAKTELPGSGAEQFVRRFLPRARYSSLSDDDKREVLTSLRERIFDYPKWPSIADRLFGDDLPNFGDERPSGERDGKSRRAGFGGPPESREHKRLKEYVAAHGRRFGAPAGSGVGQVEKRLESGDEIDVWFMTPGQQLAVEVKSARSNDSDILRGIYQCVKYRALLEAQLRAGNAESNVHVLLVTEMMPSSYLATTARRLDIRVKAIRPLSDKAK